MQVFGFRGGLRPTEGMGLRIADVDTRGGMFLLVREYPGHQLKTPNGDRVVPLHHFASKEELELVRAHIGRRLGELEAAGFTAQQARLFPLVLPHEFADPMRHAERKVEQRRLAGVHRAVLRHVTGDPHFRPYLLRHSFATWSFAALLLHDSKLLQRALVRCPQTAMWVAQGKHLGLALLDTPVDTDNRGITALTRLMGHLGSAMTLGAYVHTLDMARAHFAERATGADIPKVVLASAAQMPVSTALGLLESSTVKLLEHARVRRGWTEVHQQVLMAAADEIHIAEPTESVTPVADIDAVEPVVPVAPVAPAAPCDDLAAAQAQLKRVNAQLAQAKRAERKAPARVKKRPAPIPRDWLGLVAWTRVLRSCTQQAFDLEQVASGFGIEVGALHRALLAAHALAPLIDERLVLATVRVPAGVEALPMLPCPIAPKMNAFEEAATKAFSESAARLYAAEPARTIAALGGWMKGFDRHYHDVAFRADPAGLADHVWLLQGLNVRPQDLMLRPRSTTRTDKPPEWAIPVLGAYAQCRADSVRPGSRASPETIAQWLGLCVIDKKKQGLGMLMTRAIFTAALNVEARGGEVVRAATVTRSRS
jgi:hypothetical protein